jgi:flagellar protein FlgJ
MASLASAISPVNIQMPQQAVKPIDKNTKNVHEAAVKFEGLFMNEMLSHMFEGVNSTDNSPINGGHGEEVFRSLLTEQYGKLVSESGQTGLSKQIEKEMLKMQEQQANPHGVPGKTAGLKAFGTNSASSI